jgi:hypothetical protein
MTEYCKPSDMLTGDIAGLDGLKQQFCDMATEEMDGMIGFVYILPLSGMSIHIQLFLKNIARKLSSGWLILSQVTGDENGGVRAYGQSLVNEAMRDLWSIRNGQIELGLPKVVVAATDGNAPTLIQGDTDSGVDAFYDFINYPPYLERPFHLGPIWQPGT